MKELSLYIHIPFCVKKCLYCDFLSAPATNAAREQYLLALGYEIEARSEDYKDREVISIFFGGGTPSILTVEELTRLFTKIKSSYNLGKNCEISIEVNPGTVWDKSTFEAYRNLGINRLSIGLQSAVDKELKLLGRIHTYKDFRVTFEAAREAGFDDINVDLISAVPGQKKEDYLYTLNEVCTLNPEHISAYSLIIEPGTAFYEDYKYLITDEDHEELDRELYVLTKEVLAEKGYHRYEISNYSKEGHECRHNKVYWRRGDYLGLGLGAASLIGNRRFKNTSEFAAYNEAGGVAEYVEEETLNKSDEMQEFMILGLRLTEGISKKYFAKCFGRDIEDVYGKVLEKGVNEGLLVSDGDKVYLTDRGLDVSNYVFAQF